MTLRHVRQVAALAALATIACGRAPSPALLELSIRSSVPSSIQVFFDVGHGFREQDSTSVKTGSDSAQFQPVRMPLPAGWIRRVRLDPADCPAVVEIEKMRVVGNDGTLIADLSRKDVWPTIVNNDITSLTENHGRLRIVVSEKARDPALFVNPAPFRARSISNWLSHFGTGDLIVVVVLLGFSLILAMTFLVRAIAGHHDGLLHPRSPRDAALAVSSMILVVVGARLWLIDQYGPRVPFLDAWQQLDTVLLPFVRGALTWSDLFAPHNEHRIALTRVYDLGLFILEGQWDARVTMVANVFLAAASAALCCLLFWAYLGRRYLELLVILAALGWGLPFAWENTLWGFQSTFYILVLFFVLALWLMLGYRPLSLPWLLGAWFALCSLFTLASGMLAPCAIFVISLLVQVLWGSRATRDWLTPTLAALLNILGVALPLPAGGHQLHAQSLGAWASAFARFLAWPWTDPWWLAVLIWAPIAILFILRLARRSRPRLAEQMLFGVALWVVLQAAVIAYGRGEYQGPMQSRYMDIFKLSLIVNGLALAILLDETVGRVRLRMSILAFAAIWGVVFALGLDQLVLDSFQPDGAPGRKTWDENYQRNLRAFMASDDFETFSKGSCPVGIPFFSTTYLANAWLRDPLTRGLLAPPLRDPLPLVIAHNRNDAFAANGQYPTTSIEAARLAWGSYTAAGNPARGILSTAPLNCSSQRHLQFEVAGYLGEPGLSLDLVPVDGGPRVRVRPAHLARESWIPVTVPCPRGPFIIRAKDDSASLWFAFRAPMEVGPLWSASENVIAWGRRIFIAGLTLTLLLGRYKSSKVREGS
jgi:hypothetical protein